MKENIDIPRGNSLEANKARELLIRQHMNRFKGKSIKCPALGNIDVEIKQESINETAHHASRSYFSTKAVLDLENQIKTAKLYRYNLPKDNNQRKKTEFCIHHRTTW